MKKKPWFPFYAQDWLSDPHLRGCSSDARGLLIDMMALAHNGEPYGYLTNGGMALDEQTIAKALGYHRLKVRTLARQLEDRGRIGRGQAGQWYIPSMVRRAAQSAQAQEDGALGGNPQITKRVKGRVKPRAEQSRAEQSTPKKETKKETHSAVMDVDKLPDELREDEEFCGLWGDYAGMLADEKCLQTERGVRMKIKKLIAWGLDTGKRAVENAIEGKWKTLYEPDARSGGGRKSSTMGKDGIDIGF